jgi:Transposase DDE domain
MYLRETRQKRADGSLVTHLQLAESVWNPKKKRSEVRILYNCGRAEDAKTAERLRHLARSILKKCAPEEIVQHADQWRVIDAWPYGALYVLEALWKRLGLADILADQLRGRKLDFPVERALFAMVANRACAPCSKLYCYEQWLREDVRIEGTDTLGLQHLYRAMDMLEAHKDGIEQALYFRLADLLNLDVELIFYDTTSLHFESDEIDQGHGEDDLVEGSMAAGSKVYKAPRKRGMSKNGRFDAPQIVIGLAVTRDGLPVRHWVFPGNTVDVTTVAQVKADLRGWKLSRCVFVGDAGMVSQENLTTLSESGGKYILCMPMRRGDEVTTEVLQRPGRFQEVADNLRVKEVIIGEGERRRRYVVCHNPHEEKRQRAHRQQVLWELEAELASLKEVRGESHSKRVCQLRASRRYGRYLRLTKGGLLRIDAAKRRAAEQLDGKFVVHSNDDSLTPADLALGYKQLQRVEEAWRTLKSGLRVRPVYHWAVHRIHAHVALSVLALLLERVSEQACGDTWRNIRADLDRIKLAQLLSPHGEVWQVTEPSPESSNHLKSLELKNPPAIFHLS